MPERPNSTDLSSAPMPEGYNPGDDQWSIVRTLDSGHPVHCAEPTPEGPWNTLANPYYPNDPQHSTSYPYLEPGDEVDP